MFDIISMGSATIDAFADTDAELIEIKTKNSEEELIAYPLGSKIPIKDMRYDVGGNGVNVAVGLSRLGLKVGYIGKVGSDLNGNYIITRLATEKIEFLGARGDKSGFGIILDSHLANDRTILGYKGCNNHLKREELDFSKIKSKWIYLTSLLGESLETMKKVAKHAKDNGIKVAFNPSSSLTCNGISCVKEILERTDLLILNSEEAQDLVGKGPVEDSLKKLKDLDIETVIITNAGDGVYALDNEYFYRAKPNHVDILETTGAGDACSSGIITGIARGEDMETCIKMGMLNAEGVLTHYGAHNNLLTLKEMMMKLKLDKRELSKEKR